MFCPGKIWASCSVSVNPGNVTMGTSSVSRFNITNTGESLVNWVRIQSPGLTAFSIANMSAAGWYPNGGVTEANFAGGYLEGGGSSDFDLTLAESGEVISNMTWEALVSYDGGENFESCGSVNIQVGQLILPSITNVSLTIGSNSAVISWSTDVNTTGRVNYGTSTIYSDNKTTSSGTLHSVTISGLSPSTNYHYQIQATGESGTTTSTDTVLTTAGAGETTVTTSTVTVNTTTTTTTTNLVTRVLRDTVAPTITVKTSLDGVFESSPMITGKVVDGGEVNQGVASIDYSIDGGKNWTPVDEISDLGKKITNFEFTPPKLDDGNYLIKLRAKDVSGNTGLSKTVTMVIDRLPPQVGSVLFYSGPMILNPDDMGYIKVIEGTEVKTVMSAVGGPIKIDLLVDGEKFSLIKNEESGLWSGIVQVNKTGILKLKIRSVDGANNETEKKLNTILSVSSGKIIDESDKPVIGGKIKVYAFEKTLNDFVWWNAEPYLQNNSIETDNNGEYRLYLPTGKYFLEIENKGKRKIRSEIFETKDNVLINQNFKVNNFSLWSWWPETIKINLLDKTEEKTKNPFGN